MTRSWLCLSLLLMGALLLGQPAWGQEEEEQPSWGESNEPVPEEPEEQMVPPLAEEEEGDWEEEESLEDSDYWRPRSVEDHERMMAQARRRFMEEEAAYSARPVHDFMKHMAVAHYNKYDWQSRYGNYYKHYESSHMDVEKAQGIILTFEMTLAKTNCTKDDVSNHEDSVPRYSDLYLASQGCVLLPESEQEKYDCTFKIFLDEEYGGATVIDEYCEHVPGRTEGISEEAEVEEEQEEEEEMFEPSLEEY
ncbi:uncharacterized protein LOC128404110 [Podarcis raffonei]|uniref:uncharacterized protein LOC128404110 n=1 Tax=Podarcis raffonei TaxID=65483 RepID=UPI0023299DB5|nr:uncharacterized protein LOC128404110 [Podarcis raffonei]